MKDTAMFDRTKVIEAMRAAGLGPGALADASGVTYVTVWRVVRGHVQPTHATAKRIADALGLDPVGLWYDPAGGQ